MNSPLNRAARRPLRTCVLLALAAAPAIASAMLVTGPGGTAEQGRRTVAPPPPATTASAPSLDLAAGQLDAVDTAAGRVQVNGKAVALDTARLRVIGPDGQRLAGAVALRAGQQIRFALEPGAAPVRRIVLIYIDR